MEIKVKLTDFKSWLLCLTLLLSATSTVAANSKASLQAPVNSNIDKATLSQWRETFAAKSQQMEALLGDHGAPYINGLIDENSPYLLRHATNPINWQGWSKQAFVQAKAENKLVFLSVGYSTCHWCHVMEQDSFVNTDVGAVLNQDYISLKVDRESLPAVDELYTSALTQVTGSSGWPITAILNHQGEPLFIQSFVPQDKLRKLLSRLIKMWRKNPQFLNQNAANVMALVRKAQAVDSNEKVDWNNQILSQTRDKAAAILDATTGGFAGSPKFPSEGMVLFMLDQLEREYDPQLAKQVRLQLDQMANVGLYDSIHGGFHRYSTDANWLVPHYEKMLYNQGQLLVIYARAARLFNQPRYRQIVTDTIEFMRTWLYQKDAGFYSAIDADYLGQDGGFYLRTQAQLAQLDQAAVKQAQMQQYRFEHTELYGIYFSNPDSQAAQDIRQVLAAQLNVKPHIDKKIITAWNGLAIWGLIEAYQLTSDEPTKQLAIDVASTIWQQHFGQTDNTPVLYRDSFNGQLNDIGTLEDHAFLAKAFLAIYDVTANKQWLLRAKRLNAIVAARFRQVNGDYSMTDTRSDSPLAIAMTQTKDAEVLPAGAVMVEVIQDLWHRGGDIEVRKLMKRAANPLKARVKQQGLNHLYAAKVVANVTQKVNTPSQYFANGKGVVALQQGQSGYELLFSLQDGWHVNSATPLQKYLRPTKVSFAGQSTESHQVFEVNYPVGDTVKLGFQQEPLSVYEHQFVLQLNQLTTSQLANSALQVRATPVRFTLDVQACSDSVCLMPQKLTFVIP